MMRAAMSRKPELEIQTTTLWDYPSQHYGNAIQGDQTYIGATPSYVIWNLLQRYTRPNDLVVDPMVGSGTTIDVCKDLERRCLGFDIAPYREDVRQADARNLPLEDASADFVFVDPPYSTHVDYSDHPDCIGKLNALEADYYEAMDAVIREMFRVVKNRRYVALYVSDSFKKKKPFMPIGFRLFAILERYFTPVDIVSVVRHNKSMKRRHWHTEAASGNYFLRGFNYLFILKKEVGAAAQNEPAEAPQTVRSSNARGKKPKGRGGRRPR